MGKPVQKTLKHIACVVERGGKARDYELINYAMRLTAAARRSLTTRSLYAFLRQVLPTGSGIRASLLPHVNPKFWEAMSTRMPATYTPPPSAGLMVPEVEMFCYLVLVSFLTDQKRHPDEISRVAAWGFKRSHLFVYRGTCDLLTAKLYHFASYYSELRCAISQMRYSLLLHHRTATRLRNYTGQGVLINLLLRNYLLYRQYGEAECFRSKAIVSLDSYSINQQCRYLYYLGRIRTIQLQYTDAKTCLVQAALMAPSKARGFYIQCKKWAIMATLLSGEIPERSTFMQPGMKQALGPYLQLTNAVRTGNLGLFYSTWYQDQLVFEKDGTRNLFVRLRHNVIRAGLCNISKVYSRISLADVAAKLNMYATTITVADLEGMIAKAIRDGAIDSVLDHANGWMLQRGHGDVYSTSDPALCTFHSRITFCLQVHDKAVGAMRFPPFQRKGLMNALQAFRQRRIRQSHEGLAAKRRSSRSNKRHWRNI